MKKMLLALLLLPLLAHATPPVYTQNGTIVWDSNGNAPQNLPTHAQGPFYAALISATSGAVGSLTVVAAVSGKTIGVVDFTISTDTAGEAILHHQSGSCIFATSGSTCNFIGGGMFSAGGGTEPYSVWRPGLAQNQPVCLDVNAAMTNIIASVTYYLW